MSDKPKHAYQPAGKGESRNQGESHGRAKLSEEIVILCRQLASEGFPVSDLAHRAGVSVPTMWKALVEGGTWQHLPNAIPQKAFRPRKRKVTKPPK